MKEINIEKTKLLEVIRANRDRHLADYTTAMREYVLEITEDVHGLGKELLQFKNTVDTLDTSVAVSADDLKTFTTALTKVSSAWYQKAGCHTQPVSFAKEYDSIIRKLELSHDEIIQLSDAEFEKYVMDNWQWKQEFTNQTIGYLAKANNARV